ncbi:MAG: glycoside hydrolase family 16 protein [Candidatus Glassbacteria bacterium]|nr:glycoside hydrolase family 16 protein [Candidatus Glassbacteria bacterium]
MSSQVSFRYYLVLVLLAVLCLIAGCSEEPVGSGRQNEASDILPVLAAGQKWELIWSDEFNGRELDRKVWETPVGVRRDGYWAEEDSYLDGNGNLVIRTRKEDGKYYSGAIRTMSNFEHRYGYWIIKCKFHTQVGHWPAFWLFSNPGVGIVGDGGRDGTEIDIMEKPWQDEDRINMALHWDGYGEDHKSEGKEAVISGISQGYHTFSLYWSPEEYVFYTDGIETWRTSAGGVSQVPAYIKITDEVGEWGGDIGQANLPDYFYVDYVRVYDIVE